MDFVFCQLMVAADCAQWRKNKSRAIHKRICTTRSYATIGSSIPLAQSPHYTSFYWALTSPERVTPEVAAVIFIFIHLSSLFYHRNKNRTTNEKRDTFALQLSLCWIRSRHSGVFVRCDKRPIFTFLTFLIVGATFSAAWTGNCRVLCLLLLRFGCRFVTIAFAVDAAHSKSIYREKLNYNG